MECGAVLDNVASGWGWMSVSLDVAEWPWRSVECWTMLLPTVLEE